MRFTLGAVAALAGLSQAFLLPPTVSSADEDIVNTLPFDDATVADGHLMQINCPGCPIDTTTEGVMHWNTAQSVLRLNFTVSHGDVDALMLNGNQIYPMNPQAAHFLDPLTADQLIKGPDGKWVYSSSPRLGFSVAVKHPVHSEQDQMDLLSLNFRILQVADQFVDGIPSVEIKLLETASGKLMIGDAESSSPKSPVSHPTDGDQECTTMLCKWKAIIADRLSKLKGCASKNRPAVQVVPATRPHGHGRPRPHGPHHAHRPHRHHNKHAFGRFVRGIVSHIFVPILIGIAVGITASIVGMIVGHIAIFVWRALFRRGQQGQYVRVHQKDVVVVEGDDETKGFLEHQDAPPVYEEAVKDDKTSE